MGLHQPLLITGTGDSVRYLQSVRLLQQELEGKPCCRYTLQTHASPKLKAQGSPEGSYKVSVHGDARLPLLSGHQPHAAQG